MRVLVVLTETPSRLEALSFARQVIERTGGEQTLLAVASEVTVVPGSGQFPSDPLAPQDEESLKVRTGGFFQQVVAEIQEGDYDLAVIGADAPPSEASHQPKAARAMQLARLIEVPLAIIETCPQQWGHALICTSQVDAAWPTVRLGQQLSQQLGMESTILHVGALSPSDLDPPSEAAEGVQWRQGPLMREVQNELETERYDLTIIGLHRAPPTGTGSGPTLAHPDFSQQIMQLASPATIVIGQPEAVPIPDGALAAPTHKPELWRIVRFALVELLVYAVLVTLYAFLILRFLPAPLLSLFRGNLYLYAIVSLFVIVAQGNILEALTAFLLDRLRLERFE
jgi:hypothetical protein